MDIFSGIWDWIVNFLSECLEFIINLLPDSPFRMLDNTPIKPYLKYINWIIPVDFIIDTLALWLVAVSAYYVWSVVLRWLKTID